MHTTNDTIIDSYTNGSLSSARQGEYTLSYKKIFTDAYHLSKGLKFKIISMLLVYVILNVILSAVLNFFIDTDTFLDNEEYLFFMLANIVTAIIIWPIVTPIWVGSLLEVFHVLDKKEIHIKNVFNYFHLAVPLTIAMFMLTFLIYAGLIFLLIPGIYFSIAIMFTLPLIAHKNLTPMNALKTSVQAVHKHWFMVAGFSAITFFLTFLAFLTLGIALIWLIPIYMIAYSLMYKTIFGL